eukprot:6039846-Pyramimonas_sp.AAC.1
MPPGFWGGMRPPYEWRGARAPSRTRRPPSFPPTGPDQATKDLDEWSNTLEEIQSKKESAA